jgi:hypothetical protein
MPPANRHSAMGVALARPLREASGLSRGWRAPHSTLNPSPSMTRIDSVAKLTVPLGGQEIELQTVDFGAGGPEFLRVRVREGRRFTVFDIDAETAREWAGAMAAWAAARTGGPS